jgi:hypothetical protein
LFAPFQPGGPLLDPGSEGQRNADKAIRQTVLFSRFGSWNAGMNPMMYESMKGVSGGRLKLMALNRGACSKNPRTWLWVDQRAYVGAFITSGM